MKTIDTTKWKKIKLNDDKTAMICIKCNKEISLDELSSTKELPNAKRTGLCPVCYDEYIAQRKLKAAKYLEDYNARLAKKKDKPLSAYSQVRNLLNLAIKRIDKKHIVQCSDKEFCKENMHLTYPLLKPVDKSKTTYDNISYNGYYRYNSQPLRINGKDFYMTNHIYAKNLTAITDVFKNWKLVD